MIGSLLKYFKSYFLYGLIIIVPVAATLFIVYLAFQLLITPFNQLFSAKISPIVGFFISIFAIVGIGFISRNVIGQLVLDFFEVLISKIPLINRIYDSSKHLIDVFSSQKRQEMKPVLVEYPKDGMWVIGFLTFTSLETLGASEQSFYDALADNRSAQDLMKEEVLAKMARELAEMLRKNVTIDWHNRESVRARLRLLIKSMLRRYRYPPDEVASAVDLVLQQAETLGEELTD